MHVDRRRLGWGVFLIALGAVPVAVELGWISADVVRESWRLWPLILVGIGLGLLLQRTRLAAVGTLVVSLTFGVALGGAISGTSFGRAGPGCGPSTNPAGAIPSGTLAPGARISIRGACDQLTVTAQPGSGWTASAGTGEPAPDVTASASSLTIRSGGGLRLGASGERTLQVTLPQDPPLDLTISHALGDATVTLHGAHLSSFTADVSFGTATVDLRGATLTGAFETSFSFGSGDVVLPDGSYHGSLSSSFGSLNVCVPESVAIRLHTSSGFGSTNIGGSLSRAGDVWESPGYATAEPRADLQISSSFGSANVTRGGCS